MFIQRIPKKQKNKIYYSTVLMENFRQDGKVKHRIISNLTKWPQKLIEDFGALLKGGTVTKVEDLKHSQGKSFGGFFVVKEICKRLGIVDALGKSKPAILALFMVIGRVLSPGTSRLGLVEWSTNKAVKEILKTEGFNENDLYNSLDWLESNQEKIETKLFKARNVEEKHSELFLYDVTSSYFEGVQNDLSSFGYNRDGKKGKMQIVIGLLCDRDGNPVSVEVFKGNTSDTSTVYNQLVKLKKRFGFKKLILVGDRGMIKQNQIDQIQSKEFEWNYITAIKKAQIETLLKQGTIQLELFDEELAEVEENDTNTRYILRRNPLRAKEIRKGRGEKIKFIKNKINEKNRYLKEHKRAKPQTHLNNINELIKGRKLDKVLKVEIVEREIVYSIDNLQLKEISKLDGCYVIKTDVSNQIADKEIVHGRYKDLSKVEESFRTFKQGYEEMHPIYVRKASRTRGHVFVCMLAYMVIKSIWEDVKDLDYTRKFIFESLDAIQYIKYHIGEAEIKKIPAEYLTHQEKILSALRIELPNYL